MEPMENTEVCSNCGFNSNGASQNQEVDQLKGGSLLKERYYIGNVFSKTLDSTVYLAYDEELCKKVFVREFTGEGIANLSGKYTATELKQRFLSYAKSTATINMCEILPHTIDAFAENKGCYLVTDYFDGENLKSLLGAGINISSANAVKLVQQLLSGLKQIHNSGVVFGSISPETLYVLKNGGIRLFGIAVGFYDFLEDIESRVEVLNPSYAAPEIFGEGAKKGAYTDVYSAAAILYRLLTNEIPAISFLRSGGENLASPRKVNKNIPKNIATALLNALSWQIETRTQSPKRFLNELSANKVNRRISGLIIWANILGFLQGLYDKFVVKKATFEENRKNAKKEKANKPKRKIKFLWLWITAPTVLLAVIIILLILIKPMGSTGDGIILSSAISADGEEWYYGNGSETPTNSSKYIYGGYSSKKSDSSNKNDSSDSGSSDSVDISSKSDSSEVSNLTECPNLVGFSLSQAQKELENKGLLLGEVIYEKSTDYYPNYVINQTPQNGEKVQKGSKVNLVISKGIEIPNISGLGIKEAKDKLSEAGFTNIQYNFESSNNEIGKVIKAEFESETNQTVNDKVIIFVSGEEAQVLDYCDKTVAEAKNMASDFNLEFITADGNPIPEDADLNSYKVTIQSVKKGEIAYKGMTITITAELFNN
jgi:serine/threonine-protein kinase